MVGSGIGADMGLIQFLTRLVELFRLDGDVVAGFRQFDGFERNSAIDHVFLGYSLECRVGKGNDMRRVRIGQLIAGGKERNGHACQKDSVKFHDIERLISNRSEQSHMESEIDDRVELGIAQYLVDPALVQILDGFAGHDDRLAVIVRQLEGGSAQIAGAEVEGHGHAAVGTDRMAETDAGIRSDGREVDAGREKPMPAYGRTEGKWMPAEMSPCSSVVTNCPLMETPDV